MNSQKGKETLKEFKPQTLPFYVFNQAVEQDLQFPRIENGLVKKNNAYIFQHGVVPSNYYLNRKKKSGTTNLFIDPFFKDAADILQMILTDTVLSRCISIEPIIYSNPGTTTPGTEEFFRQEEALRWIIFGSLSDTIKERYLREYILQPASSYWINLLSRTGVNADSLAKTAACSHQSLVSHWNTVDELSIREPVVLLLNNVEKITVGGEREFRRIIQQLIP
jgi:hypothetical protein